MIPRIDGQPLDRWVLDGWIDCADQLPPEGEYVEVQEVTGQRFTLRRIGNSWFFQDGGGFVGFRLLRWRTLEVPE